MVPKKVLDLEKTYVLIPIILFWNIGSFPWMVPDPKTDVDQYLFIAKMFWLLCQMIETKLDENGFVTQNSWRCSVNCGTGLRAVDIERLKM